MPESTELQTPSDENASQRNPPIGMGVLLAYLALLLVGILAYLLIRHAGLSLSAPPLAGGSALPKESSSSAPNVLPRVLIALVAIIVSARLAGGVCKKIHQPPVIGEVLAGILLGPSLLGNLAPGVMQTLFPDSVIPPLGIIAQIGVLLFMFLVGLELNTNVLRERTHSALAISHASIVVPFVLGAALSLYLYPRFASADVPFTAFSLFLGVSMSVTAFPVLSRILTDRELHKSRMGVLALTCAAVDDVTAWCLLAFVVGVVHAKLGGAALTAGLTVLYIATMFFVVRKGLSRLVERYEETRASEQSLMAIIAVSLLLSCFITETIGIHALFGAFLLGALIRHDSWVARTLYHKLNDFVVVMLLPAFFALTGLRTQIGLIEGGAQWFACGLIILVASIGKFGGSALAARFTGLPWRDSSALGILMNTRGLMELIVLNVGLDLGVISPRLFAMLVIMAVVTTLATTPILDRLTSKDWYHDDPMAETH